MLTIRMPDHIRCEVQDHGGVVILDTKTGRWIALNSTAGEFWRTWIAGGSLEQSVARVSVRHPGTPESVIRGDARRLIDDLLSLELISITSQDAGDGAYAIMAESREDFPWPSPRFAYLLAALICLTAASVLLCCSFRVSLATVRFSRKFWSRRVPSPQEAVKTVAAVSRAARYYPGRAACLEQSLAAVLLAMGRRHRLDWCLGSASDPYRFHAWTEAGGRPVLLPGAHQPEVGFTRILSV